MQKPEIQTEITRRRSWRPILLLLLLATLLLAGWQRDLLEVPPHHAPWQPLQVEHPPNWLTRHKLDRLAEDPALCLAFLQHAGVDAVAVPDRELETGCGFRNVVRLHDAPGIRERLPLTCGMAAAWVLLDRHTLQPAAKSVLGSPIARVEHYGSYACRDVAGSRGRRSEHARANAFDLAGVRLTDGRLTTVAADWAEDSAEGRFWRQVNREACRYFGAVLGPAYNAAHADHLHLERGRWRRCS
jgi:hypothetical protein